MYVKVKDTNGIIECSNKKFPQTLCKEVNNKAYLYCDGVNSEYCNDFRKDQKNWQNLDAPFNVHFEGCYYDEKCKQQTRPKNYNNNNKNVTNNTNKCDTYLKAQCEDSRSDDFHRLCVDASYGKGNDSNICYVGDTDPCNLMDSGEDACPKACFNKYCCPGNQSFNISKSHCIGKDQKCFSYNTCCKVNGIQTHCKDIKYDSKTRKELGGTCKY